MEIKAYGDEAILIEFEKEISLAVHDRLMQLCDIIKRSSLQGILYIIPAYQSICVGYEKERYTFEEIKKKIEQLSFRKVISLKKETIAIQIPVCYEMGIDFETIIKETQLRRETIIALHSQSYYRVFMQGFVPGFAYMGILPEALKCPRKENPRKDIEKGAVAIAGNQTAIYPGNTPGGWQIIGKTPLPLIDKNGADKFLLKTGMEVKFKAINEHEFMMIKNKVTKGSFSLAEYYV